MDNTTPTNIPPQPVPPSGNQTPPPPPVQPPVQSSPVAPMPDSSAVSSSGDPVKKSNKAIIVVVVLLLLFLVLVIVAVSGLGNKPAEEVSLENSTIQTAPSPTVTEAPISTDISEGMTIIVTEPIDKSTVTTAVVSVKGTASANADVFVNEKEIKANAKGNFTTTVELDEGENVISIIANDADGNYAEKDITITYEPEE